MVLLENSPVCLDNEIQYMILLQYSCDLFSKIYILTWKPQILDHRQETINRPLWFIHLVTDKYFTEFLFLFRFLRWWWFKRKTPCRHFYCGTQWGFMLKAKICLSERASRVLVASTDLVCLGKGNWRGHLLLISWWSVNEPQESSVLISYTLRQTFAGKHIWEKLADSNILWRFGGFTWRFTYFFDGPFSSTLEHCICIF